MVVMRLHVLGRCRCLLHSYIDMHDFMGHQPISVNYNMNGTLWGCETQQLFYFSSKDFKDTFYTLDP